MCTVLSLPSLPGALLDPSLGNPPVSDLCAALLSLSECPQPRDCLHLLAIVSHAVNLSLQIIVQVSAFTCY